MMYEVYRLTMIDLPIFDREHSEGIIGVVPWVLSYRSAHAVLEDIIVPLVFSAITYFMVGLAPSADRFFYYFAIALLNHYIAVTFAGVCYGDDAGFCQGYDHREYCIHVAYVPMWVLYTS